MKFQRMLRDGALAWLLGCFALPAMAQDDAAKADAPGALFEQLDKDKDGKLTKEEVGDDRARFFNRLVRVGDKDEDGALTKEEFLAANKPEERPAQPQPGNPGGQRSQFGGGFSEEMFNRMDQNGDGKLSKAEVPEFLKERLQPAFERLDKDELTLEDLKRIAPNQFAQDRGRMSEEFFKRADANGDGKLTVDEAPEQFKPVLEGMLRRAGKEADGAITLDEFKQAGLGGPIPPGGFGGGGMLRTLDTDRDGKLSKEELVKAAEEFNKLDRNGDGGLDPRELTGFEGSDGRPNPGTPINPNANRNEGSEVDEFVNRIFERYDGDKDAKLTEKEMSELPAANKERLIKADANQDGTVTKEEVTAAMKRAGNRSRNDSDRRRTSRPRSDN